MVNRYYFFIYLPILSITSKKYVFDWLSVMIYLKLLQKVCFLLLESYSEIFIGNLVHFFTELYSFQP